MAGFKPEHGVCSLCKVDIALMPNGKPWRHKQFKDRRKPWCEGSWHPALERGA
jgi:hypothetical protein